MIVRLYGGKKKTFVIKKIHASMRGWKFIPRKNNVFTQCHWNLNSANPIPHFIISTNLAEPLGFAHVNNGDFP